MKLIERKFPEDGWGTWGLFGRWTIHACWLDREDREIVGPTYRVYMHGSRWRSILALRSRDRSQAWGPRLGTSTRWRWLSIHPARDRLCLAMLDEPRTGRPRMGCGRLKGHRGWHATIRWPKEGVVQQVRWRPAPPRH